MIAVFLANLEAVFAWLLTASWQASVLAGLVLLIQWAFRSRLSSRWAYLLWLLVVARLLCPALPESAFSLFQFAPQPPPALVHSVTAPIFDAAPSPANIGEYPAPSPVLAAPSYPFSAWTVFALAWLAGALGFLAVTWQVNRRFGRHVRAAPPVDDPVLVRLAASAQAELGLRRSLRLIESAHVQGPAIMGLFHPTLILPQGTRQKFTEAELRFIFLHEFAHLKRGDLILQWLVAVLQIVHWFNPVLWFAFRRMRADREPATDALVLSRTGEAEAYGHVLIKLLEHYHRRHALPTLVGILEDKDQFKRRFLLIGRFTRGAYGWSLLGVLLIGILALACLTRSKFTQPPLVTKITTTDAGDASSALVRVALFAVQLGENDYQAHRSEIDAAVQRGDIAPLSLLRSFNLLSQPAALTGSGEQCTMEEIRVMPYPVKWDPEETIKNKDGSSVHMGPTPTDFKRQNLGVRSVVKPTINGHLIDLVCDVGVVTFADWTATKELPHVANFNRRRLLVSESFQPNVSKGFQVPGGAQMEPADPTSVYFWDETKPPKPQPKSLVRLFVFLSASIANAEGGALTSKARTDWEIIDAVKRNDATALARLVQGVDIKQLQDDGHPLLFSARSPEAMKILLEHGADPNVRDKDGGTIWGKIDFSGKNVTAIIKVLLEHGADPNMRMFGPKSATPIFYADNAAMIDLLIKHGADPRIKMDDGSTPLMRAAQHKPEVFAALLRGGVPFDVKTDGPTVLVQAAWNRNLPLAKDLLARGVDPNLPGVFDQYPNGKPFTEVPLEAAAVTGASDVADVLLAGGAKGEKEMVVALHNRNMVVVKSFWTHGVRAISPLCYAVSQGAPVADLQKLLDKGSPVDPPQDTVLSPLATAALMGKMGVVKFLVAHGANVDKGGILDPAYPIYRLSPLVMGAAEGQDEVVSFLLDHGAKADPIALWQAANNSTPYDNQRSKDHFEKTVRILLDAGALKQATQEQQGYILSGAIGTRQGPPNPTVVKMLLDTGADPNVPMPYLVDHGEKPNSVLGYYRERYAKYKNDASVGPVVAPLKPLLDLLEASAAAKHGRDAFVPALPAVMPVSGRVASSPKLAATVDDHAITAVEVEQQSAATEQALRKQFSGPTLAAKIDEAREKALHAQIDRRLILEDFRKGGYGIPKEFIDDRVNDQIKARYGENRDEFLRAMADRHRSLADFRQEIADNAAVLVARNAHVTEKLAQYYRDHRDLFPADNQCDVTLVAIQFHSDQPGDRARQRLVAEQSLAEIKAGADIRVVGKRFPTLFGAENDGWLAEAGPSSLMSYPAIWQGIKKVKAGETSEVIEGPWFYVIARVNQRRPAKVPATPATEHQKEQVLDAEEARLKKEWLEPLRTKAIIQYVAPYHNFNPEAANAEL